MSILDTMQAECANCASSLYDKKEYKKNPRNKQVFCLHCWSKHRVETKGKITMDSCYCGDTNPYILRFNNEKFLIAAALRAKEQKECDTNTLSDDAKICDMVRKLRNESHNIRTADNCRQDMINFLSGINNSKQFIRANIPVHNMLSKLRSNLSGRYEYDYYGPIWQGPRSFEDVKIPDSTYWKESIVPSPIWVVDTPIPQPDIDAFNLAISSIEEIMKKE